MEAILNRPVLVLNKSWQPINVLRLTDAITKIFLGIANVVDPEDYQMYEWDDWAKIIPNSDDPIIRGGNSIIKIPEVIVLTTFSKLPQVGVTFNRRNLYVRDEYTCQYCGKKDLDRSELTIDHVIPRAQKGTSTWENCVVACFSCNHGKADRTPKQAGLKLRTVPKKPRWVPSYKKGILLSSWGKFVSDMYWHTPLEEK